MQTRSLIALAAVAGALAGPLAPQAMAGTYNWQLPTSSAPGASNPDHDGYGATPWTYVEAANASSAGPPPLVPSSFAPLGSYSTTIDGGLVGWQDLGDGDHPFVAVNRGGSALSDGSGLQIPSGQLALQPAADRVVGIGWTSPFSSPETVTIAGTFQPDDQGSGCPGSQPTWVIEQDGLVLTSEPPPAGSPSGGAQQFSATATVSPGDTVYLVVGWYGVPAGFSPHCTTAGVSLNLQAPSTPPTVTLSSPADGQTIREAQPSFVGSASRRFGDSAKVTVRVWRGSSTTGTPTEILAADGSGGTYSVMPQPPLPSGTYTARAEQGDLAGDVAYSDAVTFAVHNTAPTVTVAPPTPDSLRSSSPVLEGTAGTNRGDSASVLIGIWSGASAKGHPIRSLTATRGADGRWSVQVKPSLDNGRYTAVAVQTGPGGTYGVSKSLTFKVNAKPAPTIVGAPTLDSSNRASIRIVCTATTGSCTGDVLVVTQRTIRPLPDGPAGHVRVLFAYASAQAGRTVVVTRPVTSYVAAALRHASPVRVLVTVRLKSSTGRSVAASAVAVLRLIR